MKRPWAGTRTALLGGERVGDYVQLLVETGVPGLLIGLWAGLSALVAAERDPWLLAALAGLLILAGCGTAAITTAC